MLDLNAVDAFADRQKRLLLTTYNHAWHRGVAAYGADTALHTPDNVRRAVALAPAYRGVNKMVAELSALTPLKEATIRLREAYNPDEPRNEKGEWDVGGGAGKSATPASSWEGGTPEHGMSGEQLERNLARTFGPNTLEGGYEPHPRSGYDVRVGVWKRVAAPPEGQTEGPPVFKLQDYGAHAGDQPFPRDAGTEPIDKVYRGVTPEEWQQAQQRGYIQSDQRGTIADWEGTNAAVDPRDAVSYLPFKGSSYGHGEGRVLQITVKPEDNWFTTHDDDYLRTRSRIPLDRVTAVSPVIVKDEDVAITAIHEAGPLDFGDVIHTLNLDVKKDEEGRVIKDLHVDTGLDALDYKKTATKPKLTPAQKAAAAAAAAAGLAALAITTQPENVPTEEQVAAVELGHQLAYDRAKEKALELLRTPGGEQELLHLESSFAALRDWIQSNAYRLDAGESVAWAGEQAGYAEAAAADDQLLAWHDIGDDRECADCRSLASMPPQVLADWPVTPGDGATECNVGCFAAETPVEGAFISGLEAFYAGQMVELETASGARVTLTPNHPVATTRGFVPAGDLSQGDYLFHRIGGQTPVGVIGSFAPAQDDHDAPTSIQQVLRALEELGGGVRAAARGHDLHGDGRRVADGQIKVVAAHRHLVGHLQTSFTQHRRECTLEQPVGLRAATLMIPREQLTVTNLAPSSGCPRCRELALDERAVALDSLPLDALRVGSPTQFDTRLSQAASECPSADAEFVAQLLDRGSSEIVPDQLVKVHRMRNWRGYVYDLQSTTGWLLAGSLVCSNCRCSLEAVGTVLPNDTYIPLLTDEHQATVSKLISAQAAAMSAMMPDASYLE